jgi:hypothetical protein
MKSIAIRCRCSLSLCWGSSLSWRLVFVYGEGDRHPENHAVRDVLLTSNASRSPAYEGGRNMTDAVSAV